ncbi:MAG: ABC transporter permease [Lachnospiraceae bacterium]|nr:ABC transporter permease [Lachnospiraceae bacterium]
MIKAYCKRVLLFLPYVLCYFLALGIGLLALVMYASEFLFEDKTDSIVSVACYIPDNEAYTRLGINLVNQMDSIKNTIDINQVDSEEEALRLVETGDAVAGVIVPEGFIETLGTPLAKQAQIVYRDADTFEEHIVNDLLYVMSDLLGAAQCSILTAGEYAEELGLDIEEVYAIENDVSTTSFNYVMDRKTLFHKVDAEDIVAKYNVKERLAASYTLYIIMMSVFVISFFYRGNSEIFRARAKLSGIGKWRIFLLEAACAAVMMYLLYVLIFVCLCFIFESMKILSLITVIPFILIVALAGTALCYIVKSPTTVSYITFGAGTSLMYLAGGLIPLDFMPHFFQTAADYNLVHYLIVYFMRSMFL